MSQLTSLSGLETLTLLEALDVRRPGATVDTDLTVSCSVSQLTSLSGLEALTLLEALDVRRPGAIVT